MNDNIFFDLKRLKKVGKNVIIGKTVRIRYPELVEIGDNVIIDDFSYISTALKLNDYCHISAGAKIIGGKDSVVEMDSFSTLAPQVVLSAGSDDYESGIATPMVSKEYKGAAIFGKISIGRHSIIGSGSVVLPNVNISDGVAVGALSLVKYDLEAWRLYAGIPVKFLKDRRKEEVLKLEQQFWKEIENA